MKITVIDNYDSFVFNLVRYLNEIETIETVIQRNDKINFDELNSCDAILLSPGPGIPSEAGRLMEIVETYQSQKPILGVCLGHQAIAEYFGAELKCLEFPMHGKASLVKHQGEDEIFNSIPIEFTVGRYHSWSLNHQLPSEIIATAFSDDNEIMAIKHKELPVKGVQFHPESILTEHGRKMINNWVTSIEKTQ
ncbi:MAG: aminodeoxychorismate/anthranilate synthase component II [Crocinitomicaceae bacterium]|nr:aminodeoxychorismate/anthranilate synthase component II [Crocinitomicaceae bacterium]